MTAYFPAADNWQSLDPATAGFDPAQLAAAFSYAATQEIAASRDLRDMVPKGERHPYDRQLGPLQDRSPAAGLVVKNGYLVGSFGPIDSVEVTFSCSKSYISAVAGLACNDGLFNDLDEPVGHSVKDGGFDSAHNAQITWRHLLQLTSEWEGELFCIPDWIDRDRKVGSAAPGMEGSVIGGSAALVDEHRALQTPGTFWEYNDIRVNRAALALLRLYHKALPEILKTRIMDPIGASATWQWHGYQTSWVEENGEKIQAVSGGAHWGGGIWINSYDHARFGLLYSRRGYWGDRQLLPEAWIGRTLQPCDLNPEYGLLWWLNHQHAMSDLACVESFAARGAGGNIVFVEPQKDLVIVLRWCGNTKGVIDRILASEKAGH